MQTLSEFQSLKNLSDLAHFLGFTPKKLSYLLYHFPGGIAAQYNSFPLVKKSGKIRTITAPSHGIKSVQSKLAEKLQDIYRNKRAVHGFIPKKSILTNARQHTRKNFVFNVDLEDFFPSVSFVRIMGLFMAKPYNFDRTIAILIAKIACFQDKLPQGSPCSPIISNMLCSHMDRQLTDLAHRNFCYYTRYADDITFSTKKLSFPIEIAALKNNIWIPGASLCEIISNHGFCINEDKTRMRQRCDRQIVTGLTVNDFPNVQRKMLKQVRAMLHDWYAQGYQAAQDKYIQKFCPQYKNHSSKNDKLFMQVVRGKLEYIRHIINNKISKQLKNYKNDNIRTRGMHSKDLNYSIHNNQFFKYLQRYNHLLMRDSEKHIILGEGETDWIHLKKALENFKKNGKFVNLELYFHKHKAYETGGHTYLTNFCENKNNNTYKTFSNKVICIYDADEKSINKKHQNKDYCEYENNIYSLVLPKPSFRTSATYSIEQLYRDVDIKRKDGSGRRLYLSTEFDKYNGKLSTDNQIRYGTNPRTGEQKSLEKLKGDESIIDSYVCKNENGKLKSVAMSKKAFAINIIKEEKNFQSIDFSGFEQLFTIIEKICQLPPN